MSETGTITNSGSIKNAGTIGGAGTISGNAVVTLEGGKYTAPAILAQSMNYSDVTWDGLFAFLQSMNATSYESASALENAIWPGGTADVNYIGLEGLDESKYYYVVTREANTNKTIIMGQQVAAKTETTAETRTYYLTGKESIAPWWWAINLGASGSDL